MFREDVEDEKEKEFAGGKPEFQRVLWKGFKGRERVRDGFD